MPPSLSSQDTALVACLGDPDETQARTAFETLFRAWYTSLVRFAAVVLHSPYDAEEVVQDVFLNLWRTRRTVAIKSFSAYLFSAVRNMALMRIRHAAVVERIAGQSDALHPIAMGEHALPPDTLAERDELVRAIDRVVAKLPERQRTAFILRWQHTLSYPEIGAILGVSANAARVQLDRIEQKLAKALRQFR